MACGSDVTPVHHEEPNALDPQSEAELAHQPDFYQLTSSQPADE